MQRGRAETAEQQLTEAQERITALEGALRAKVAAWRDAAERVFAGSGMAAFSACADELDEILTPSSGSPKQTETERLYRELLFAVAQKFPNETRHQTALRYIRQREEGGSNSGVNSGLPRNHTI